MDLPGVGANHKDVEKMKRPPIIHQVIAGLPFLTIAVIIYLIARCAGWNPN